jgi:hypothetical protein
MRIDTIATALAASFVALAAAVTVATGYAPASSPEPIRTVTLDTAPVAPAEPSARELAAEILRSLPKYAEPPASPKPVKVAPKPAAPVAKPKPVKVAPKPAAPVVKVAEPKPAEVAPKPAEPVAEPALVEPIAANDKAQTIPDGIDAGADPVRGCTGGSEPCVSRR